MPMAWKDRPTKFRSMRVEVGAHARLRALAGSRGVTQGQMLVLLLDGYERGVIEEKVAAVPRGAVVETVTFPEE